jgi:hypothetical protein
MRNRSVGKVTVVFDGLVPPVVGKVGAVRLPPVVGFDPGGGDGGVVGGGV